MEDLNFRFTNDLRLSATHSIIAIHGFYFQDFFRLIILSLSLLNISGIIREKNLGVNS